MKYEEKENLKRKTQEKYKNEFQWLSGEVAIAFRWNKQIVPTH